jgi:hypothetical protein
MLWVAIVTDIRTGRELRYPFEQNIQKEDIYLMMAKINKHTKRFNHITEVETLDPKLEYHTLNNINDE